MAVLIFDKHNQCFQFASGDIAETLARFEQAVEDPSTQREHKTNADVRWPSESDRTGIHTRNDAFDVHK